MKNILLVNSYMTSFLLIFLVGCLNSLQTNTETYSTPPTDSPLSTPTDPTENSEALEDTLNYYQELDEPNSNWEKRCGDQEYVSITTPYPFPYKLLVFLSGTTLTYKTIGEGWVTKNLEIANPYRLFASSDGEWLSYYKRDNLENPYLLTSVEFISLSENEQYSVPWQDDWKAQVNSPWFNSNYIRFLDTTENDAPVEYLLTHFNELVKLDWSRLPNIYPQENYAHAWVNPSLTHVLYATSPYLDDKYSIQSYRLWDIHEGKVIWESPNDFILDSAEIAWANDGSVVAFPGRYRSETRPDFQMYELYTLSLDGDLSKVGAFADNHARFSIHALVWSPDGNKLLFVFTDEQYIGTDAITISSISQPMMFDLETGNIISFCFEGDSADSTWSPDSSRLAFISSFANQRHLVVLNVDNGDLYITPFEICNTSECKLPEDLRLTGVLGWIQN